MLSDIPYIETYRGFANEERIIFNARLLKDKNHIANENDSFIVQLKNIFRKVASREIPFGNVSVSVNANNIPITADNEGYIFLDSDLNIQRNPETRWEKISINARNNSFQCEYLIPSSRAAYGIITDIDDTILVTDVHRPISMLINSLFKNPFQRKSFNGILEFYNLHSDQGRNPVFYLSNSPWNLYQNIKQFLEIQHLPKGPILLRDYGLHFPRIPVAYSNHKEINIELLLEVYPRLPFILIGDASQEDAFIYSHIKSKFPDRIKGIYIREIDDHEKMEKLKNDPTINQEHMHYFKDYTSIEIQ